MTINYIAAPGHCRRLRQHGLNVEILCKTPIDGYIASSLTLIKDAFFSGTTEKQMGALLTAYTIVSSST
jgi:hypothetical protein